MFMPPKYPSHLTTQMQNVEFINTRMRAKDSNNPDEVSWYIDLSGNLREQETFAIAKERIDALVASGWTNHGAYDDLYYFLSKRPALQDRYFGDVLRFTTIAFTVDGEVRYYFLEGPSSR